MKWAAVILTAGCFWSAPELFAQELPLQKAPFLPPITRSANSHLPLLKLRPVPLWQLQSPLKPVCFNRPTVQQRKAQHVRKRKLNEEAAQWRITIGNTSVNNWSPYPDRALDARTLRFPLPRKPKTQQPKK